MDEFTRIVQKNYGVQKKPITTRNSQVNSIYNGYSSLIWFKNKTMA